MSFDASVPNAARVYDFFLGGKDNYASDLIVAVLHFVADADRPYEAVRTIVDALPPGNPDPVPEHPR